jgi:hypothetical protein
LSESDTIASSRPLTSKCDHRAIPALQYRTGGMVLRASRMSASDGTGKLMEEPWRTERKNWIPTFSWQREADAAHPPQFRKVKVYFE